MLLTPFSPAFLLWLLFAIILLAVVSVIVGALLPERERPKYLYLKKEQLLTPFEQNCFNSLLKTVGGEYYVFPQIHLASILNHKVRGQNWRGAFRHIDEKSIDFLLCEKDGTVPVLAIELDDWTHEQPDRQERDREVERVCLLARLPLLRLPHNFAEDELQKKVHEAIRPI